MELNINGMVISLSDTGRVSKGGNAIHEVKGAALQDGTKLYLTAYVPSVKSEAVAKAEKSITPRVRKAVVPAPVTLQMEGNHQDLNAMIAAALAQALKGLVPAK